MEHEILNLDRNCLCKKGLCSGEAPKFNLNVRHFGDVPGVVNRYVCVYKTKPKEQILEEVLKMRGAHPKYTITTDRLPPHLGLNVF
ncbi:hypothetical protein J6590_016061 [Homalodisca vitripennis]|nr:hypothetical protein J6590_016061 [Homalodisca vitripennis]